MRFQRVIHNYMSAFRLLFLVNAKEIFNDDSIDQRRSWTFRNVHKIPLTR